MGEEHLGPATTTFVVRSGTMDDDASRPSVRPTSITLHGDAAVAWYGEAPLLRYESLDALLARHQIEPCELDCADAPPASRVLRRSHPPTERLLETG